MDGIAAFGDLSTSALAVLAASLVVQTALQAVALIDLWRRPSVMIGRKWVWVGAVVLGGLMGLYFYGTLGRVPAAPSTGAHEPPIARREPHDGSEFGTAGAICGTGGR